MRTHRFTSTTFFIWGGLLVYALSFLVVYVFGAVACAKGFATLEVVGMSIVTFATLAWSIVAGAAIAALALIARRRDETDTASTEHDRIIRFLVMTASGLALLALAWLTLPALTLRYQCG
jgi:heme/copper-type cytochrome/quinol oxidase subunit 2